MSFTIKASLFQNWSTEPIESRRFSIDQDVATNYVYLVQKLSQAFGDHDLKADDIVVSYIGLYNFLHNFNLKFFNFKR